MEAHTIKVKDCSDMNLTVVITHRLMLRLWVAMKLITLATWVMGCGLTVELNEELETHEDGKA